MVKRIDLFMPPQSHYGVLHHFTKQMFNALQAQGVECRLLEAKRDDPASFLKTLFASPPECTLSFNGLLPDDKGNFFCDLIRIPHVACIVDSQNSFLPLIRSKYSLITCVDRTSVDFFQGIGFNRSMFLPHAIEKSAITTQENHREYDVVMLSSCIDYEGIHATWKKKYAAPLVQAMEEAAENTLATAGLPYYQAFVQALDKQVNQRAGIDPQKVDFVAVLDDLEMYIRGKDRLELINAIQEAKVHIFGSADGTTGWKKYVGHKKNVEIHDPVPFEQALDIMRHSKIVLNSSPWIAYGAHERILAGIASGALVLTGENPYLQQQFREGESIVFYQSKQWDKANHRINEYLVDNKKRQAVVSQGQEIVKTSHTWDQRAAQLLQELPALLKTIQK